MLYLRVDEMATDARHDVRENAVRDDRDLLDSPVMLLDELQVGKQPAEVFQPGNDFARINTPRSVPFRAR